MNKSVCTICADYLTCSNSATCPCGHIFHYECIIRWKEQSSTCPQCRIRFKAPIKLYFELSSEDKTEGDPAVLRNEVSDLNLKVKVKESFVTNLKKDIDKHLKEISSLKEEIKTLKLLLDNALGTNDALKKQLTYVEKYKDEAKRNRSNVLTLEKKLSSFQNIQALVEVEHHDIERTIKNFVDTPDSFNQVVTSYVVLKKEFVRLKDLKKALEHEKNTYRKKAESASRESFEAKEQLKVVTNDLKYLDEKNKSLAGKLSKMEQALASPSPRSSAIKRFLQESPAPADLKRKCLSDTPEGALDESIILLDATGESGPSNEVEEKSDDEDSVKFADEFGLQYVATTCISSKRHPLREMNKTKNNKCGFTTKMPLSNISSKVMKLNDTSDLPHVRRGFNGMGGHSKVLVLPKKTASLVKPGAAKKIPRTIKLHKNARIPDYNQFPRLPHLGDS